MCASGESGLELEHAPECLGGRRPAAECLQCLRESELIAGIAGHAAGSLADQRHCRLRSTLLQLEEPQSKRGEMISRIGREHLSVQAPRRREIAGPMKSGGGLEECRAGV